MSYNEIKEKPLALVNHYFLPTLLILPLAFGSCLDDTRDWGVGIPFFVGQAA